MLGLLALASSALMACAVRTPTAPERAAPARVDGTSPLPTGTGPPPALLSEFHGAYTLLLLATGDGLAERRRLAWLDHAPNWAPRLAVSPDGGSVAYTLLPAEARAPEAEAELWVLPLRGGGARRLAVGVDLRTTPIWSPDGARVVTLRPVQETDGASSMVVDEIAVHGGTRRALARGARGERLFPVGYTPDGRAFYLVRFARDATVIEAVDTGSGARRSVARLAPGVVRDVRLAPDGARLLLLALEGAPARYRARVIDLATGAVHDALDGAAREEDVGVAWRPGGAGTATVGSVAPSGGRVVLVDEQERTVTAREAGFDVPVAWSPDGRYLAVRAFAGADTDHPGAEQPVLVDVEGRRQPVRGAGPLEFIGWLANGP
jgi:dipeptidyl aminopeptidase/acylaminoacyl peptidase